jgi:hypothetical protein
MFFQILQLDARDGLDVFFVQRMEHHNLTVRRDGTSFLSQKLGSELTLARLTFEFPISFHIRGGFFRSFTIFRKTMCAAAQKLWLAST